MVLAVSAEEDENLVLTDREIKVPGDLLPPLRRGDFVFGANLDCSKLIIYRENLRRVKTDFELKSIFPGSAGATRPRPLSVAQLSCFRHEVSRLATNFKSHGFIISESSIDEFREEFSEARIQSCQRLI